MSNGQYYGGWGAYTPAYPHQHPYHQYQHGSTNMNSNSNSNSSSSSYPYQPRPRPQQATQQANVPPRQLPPTQQLTQTATIRNAVNLKKASLAISPLQEDPSKMTISFSFDASAPCAVSIFLFATEEVSKGCALTSKFHPQQKRPAVLFDKGLGLKFPAGAPEGESAAAAMQHVVDMSMLQDWSSTTQGTESGTEVFPLVIRLEVINERGLKDGKTLKDILPGGEQKDWIQSQTTYATIRHEDDGGWTIKVMKQKIWVEGVSYELQEIYGLEHAAENKGNASGTPGSTGSTDRGADDAEERLCVVCLVNPRDTTVLPCRHMCLCSDCASELRKQTSKCPICRNNIESLLHIKISKEGQRQAQGQA